MKALIPALVFFLISAFGVVSIVVWQKKYGQRAKAVKRHIRSAEALRKIGAEDQLRHDFVEQAPLLEWLNSKLEGYPALRLLLIRADCNWTAAEFVMLSIGMFFSGLLLAFALLNLGALGVINTGLIFGFIPWWYISGKANKRRIRFEGQLPEALDFISRSLRAGHGLTASMGMAGDELPQPIGRELKETFEEINFGIPFQEAMSNLMSRINSPDLTFFTVAVVIQRETGGNLTELLANLSKLIRERIKLKGKVRVLASEGKFSGILLASLPFVMGGLLTVINPEYMSTLWYTPEGHKLIITGLGMLIVGAFFMHRIVQIKV